MKSISLGTFDMPVDLPVSEYDKVMAIVGKHQTQVDVYKAFVAAWTGVAYRCRGMNEFAHDFLSSANQSTSPEINERFRQDNNLFCFFAAGLSALECVILSSYCVGSLANPVAFPISVAKDLDFRVAEVLKRFKNTFPSSPVSTTLEQVISCDDYQQLSNFRNALAHRGTPPRTHYAENFGPGDKPSAIMSNPKALPSDWQFAFELSDTAMQPVKKFVLDSVSKLIVSLETFAASELL